MAVNPYKQELERRRTRTNPYAAELERRQRRKQAPGLDEAAQSLGGGFTRGALDMLGLPAQAFVGAGQFLSDVTGATALEQNLRERYPETFQSIDRYLPTRGLQDVGGTMESGLADAGLATPPDQEHPIPPLGKFGEILGASAAGYGVMGAPAVTGAQGNIVTRPMYEAYRSAPKATAVAEGMGAVGAGVGGTAASEMFPGNQTAENVGTMLGGFALPGAMVARQAVHHGAPASGRIREIVQPYTNPRRALARQVRDLYNAPGAGDPQESARILAGPRRGVGDLTPAQETGDPTLLRLEKAFQKAGGDTSRALDVRRAQTREAIEATAEEIAGTPSRVARDYMQGRINNALTKVEAVRQRAIERATQAINDIKPNERSPAAISSAARKHLDDAYDYARRVEKELWDQVPADTTVDAEPLLQEYRSIVAGLSKAEKANLNRVLPAEVRKLFGKGAGKGKNVIHAEDTLNQVKEARTLFMDLARQARAGETPNSQLARTMNRLTDAATDVMASAPGTDEARAYTRWLHDRFSRGPVGRVLGTTRTGGMRASPEETMQRIIGSGGESGSVGLNDLRQAVSERPETLAGADNAIKDFLRNRFVSQVTDQDGRVLKGSAERFVRNNRDILERYPDLRREMMNAQKSQATADRVTAGARVANRNINDRLKSRAALFLDAQPGDEVRRVLQSREPAKAMRDVVRIAAKDPRKEALQGVRAQFVDDMLKAKDPAAFARENRAVIDNSGLFTKDQRQRLDELVDTYAKLEAANARGESLQDVLDEAPDQLVDLVGSILGANLGSHAAVAGATGTPLVLAGRGARFFRTVLQRTPVGRTRDIATQFVLDRNVARDVLSRVDVPPQKGAVRRVPYAWLYQVVPELEMEVPRGTDEESVRRQDRVRPSRTLQ